MIDYLLHLFVLSYYYWIKEQIYIFLAIEFLVSFDKNIIMNSIFKIWTECLNCWDVVAFALIA